MQLWGPSRHGVSHGVALEPLNSQYWQTIDLEVTGPLKENKSKEGRKKGNAASLPGIQSHSSPCRSLVVWGRRALSVRSSLLLCLETKKEGIEKCQTNMYQRANLKHSCKGEEAKCEL